MESPSHLPLPICFAIVLTVLLASCASVTPIPGGPEDTDPPEIVSTKSTPNLQRRFEKQPIRLTFNEWVEVKDIGTQVIVSPPLEFSPDIDLKGKSVYFQFNEEERLRPDATYTINFGESVRDYTEGNPTPNLRFVFSTGDNLDSLSVSGKVEDAFTGEPIPGAMVLLYDQLADTIIRAERPFYFARTNEAGQFRIENVKGGQFRAFALIDNNFNYLYDLPGESPTLGLHCKLPNAGGCSQGARSTHLILSISIDQPNTSLWTIFAATLVPRTCTSVIWPSGESSLMIPRQWRALRASIGIPCGRFLTRSTMRMWIL